MSKNLYNALRNVTSSIEKENGGIDISKVESVLSKIKNDLYKNLDPNGNVKNSLKLDGKPLESIVGIGTKNLVINGDFSVNQRGKDSYTYVSDAENETTSGGHNLDRFSTSNIRAGGSFTITQGELPNGSKSWKCTVDSPVEDLSDSAERYWYGLSYKLEGQHIYQIAKQGKFITISFLFNTNVAGVYSIALRNATSPIDWDNVDRYLHEFNHSGNGVEKIKITVPLNYNFNPALVNDENRSLDIIIGFIGDSYTDSILDTWTKGNKLTTPNCVNWGAAEGNFIEIAELQVEEGETATAFERVPYELQLMRCMRYYYKTDKRIHLFQWGALNNNNWFIYDVQYPVQMRVTPSVCNFASRLTFAGDSVNEATVLGFDAPNNNRYGTHISCNHSGDDNANPFLDGFFADAEL